MPIATHPNETWEFTFPDEQEEFEREMKRFEAQERENAPVAPAVFKLKPISVKDWASIEDNMARVDSKSGEISARTATRALEVLRLGLAGWKGFRFANGEEAAWRVTSIGVGRDMRTIPTDATLELLPPDARRLLADEILRGNRATAQELGNSLSPITSR